MQDDDAVAMAALEKHLSEKKSMTDSGEKRRKPDSVSPEPSKKKANVVVEEEDESFIRANSADSESLKSKGSSPGPMPSSSHSSNSNGSGSASGSKKAAAKSSADNRPLCKYDTACYRKNPDHFKEFRHSNRDD